MRHKQRWTRQKSDSDWRSFGRWFTEAALAIRENEVRLTVRPFQIITLRLLPQAANHTD